MTTAAEYLERAEVLYRLGGEQHDKARLLKDTLNAAEGCIRAAETMFAEARTAAAIAAAQAAMVAAGMTSSPVRTRVDFNDTP